MNLNALTFLEALFFICFTRLICLGILRRQYAELLLKALGKIAGRTESHPVGHFRHIQFSVLKKLGSPLQTNGTDKFRRSLSGNSLQLSVKIHTAHSHIGTQLFHVILGIVDMFFYQFQGFLKQLLINRSNCYATGIDTQRLAEFFLPALLLLDKLLDTHQ